MKQRHRDIESRRYRDTERERKCEREREKERKREEQRAKEREQEKREKEKESEKVHTRAHTHIHTQTSVHTITRTHQSHGVLWSLVGSRDMHSSSSGRDVLQSYTCSFPPHALPRPQISLGTVLMLHTHSFLPHSPSTLSFLFPFL